MDYIGWALTANVIGLIWPLITALKQKHYVKRKDGVFAGLSLIVIAFGLAVEKPDLYFWVLPLYAYPLIQAILGIGLITKNIKSGLWILSGAVALAMGLLVLIAQFLLPM